MESSWYDHKSQKLLLHMNILTKVMASMGPAGLVGIDKLYSYMIRSEIDSFIKSQHEITTDKNFIDTFKTFSETMENLSGNYAELSKIYLKGNGKLNKIWPKFLNLIISIGQKQIFRKHIAIELSKNCNFDAKDLNAVLSTMNE